STRRCASRLAHPRATRPPARRERPHLRLGARRARVRLTVGRRARIRSNELSSARRRRAGDCVMSGIATDLLARFVPVAFIMFVVVNLSGLLGWVERKQSAVMQDRIGANRASIFGIRILGLLHPLADALKMLTKEDFMPAHADRLMFTLAPFVSAFF